MPVTTITRAEAEERARLLRVEAYEVALDLGGGEPTFRSETTVRFAAASPGASTFVDLVAPEIERAVLNGRPLDSGLFDGSRLRLPELAAENTLAVVARCAYSHTGEGLHRFVDPVDGETYLYSQFEVADARRVFAVFDQPDLKAPFRFTVTAPNHWQVLSNVPPPPPAPAGEGRATWRFDPTLPLASYVTAIVAGPYHRVEGTVVLRDGRALPLGVFCRASLASHLDADEILDVTKKGFAFFEDAFDTPYPFAKYDQVFVPEFNAGAMENAGCVTVRDEYVFRSRVAESRYERRAETILHELAHMWFGDLVTMRWWDDLWLNESFATYASVLCQAEATRWRNAWTTFALSEKTWAYRQDQLSSTHPIVAEIRDLDDVAVNFDGITYAKGASVLKQLVAWVGREAFFAGLRQYFRAHAWGNTTLADLLAELEETSGRDLRGWSRAWLERAGVTVLRPVLGTDAEGRFTRIAIAQEAPPFGPTLAADALQRPHRLGIGLYDRDGQTLVRRQFLEVDVVGERTDVPELVGVTRPDVLLLNDEDLAYAKIRLDEVSLGVVLTGEARFADSLPRAICWAAAWDMVRDAELPARDYVRLALGGVGTETDSSVIGGLLSQLGGSIAFYMDPTHRDAAEIQAADTLDHLMRAAEPGSTQQFQLASAFIRHARTPEQLQAVGDLLEGRAELPGLPIDTDLRWALLHRLVSRGLAGETEVAAELERDPTATGQERAASARAAMPTAGSKAVAWAAVVERQDLPNAMVEAIVGGFAVRGQEELLRPYVEPYFASIARLWESRPYDLAETLIRGFFPTLLADQALLDRANAWLAQAPDVPALRRLVAEERDNVKRMLRAQTRDARAADRHNALQSTS